MKILITALLLVLLTACSPSARLARLIKNHPELAKVDTIFKSDTIVIPPAKADTVIYYKQTDTVIVKDNGVTVKYFYNTKDSTVYIRGERDTIRIIREIPVSVNNFEVKPETTLERIYRVGKDILLIASFGAIVVMLILLRKVLK